MSTSNGVLDIINSWVVRLFCLFWMTYLLTDYLQNSDYITNGHFYFQYWDALFVILILSIGFVVLLSKNFKPKIPLQLSGFNGLMIYGIMMLFMAVIFGFFMGKMSGTSSPVSDKSAIEGVFSFVFINLSKHVILLFVLVSAYAFGNLIARLAGFNLNLHKDSRLIVELAFGFSLLVLVMFILGAIKLQIMPVLLAILVIPIAVNYKQVWHTVKRVFWTPIKDLTINPLGVAALVVILIFTGMNLMNMNRPMPIGFDALNLYMNIPKLIDQYGGWVEGGQAFSWSYIMSIGFTAFGSTSISLLLSIVPGILAMFALYRLARNFVGVEWALFSCAGFYTIPVIMWQSKSDAKVDLGLVFVLIAILLLIIEHYFFKAPEKKKKEPAKTEPAKKASAKSGSKTSSAKKQPVKKAAKSAAPSKTEPAPSPLKGPFTNEELAVWVMTGWLTGFAFGIKYTALIMILGIIVYLFYQASNKWAAIGFFFINFSLIFGLGLYKFSNLDIGSSNTFVLILAPLIVGLAGMVMGIITDREGVITAIKRAAIMGAVTALAFSPWVFKNIAEHGSVSMESIVSGKSPLPDLIWAGDGATGDNLQQEEEKEIKVLAAQTGGQPPAADNKDKKNNNQAPATGGSGTGKYEEINRYIGYEKGLIRFISLFYDSTMKHNVRLVAADIGLLLFMVFPLLMLTMKGSHLPLNIGKIIFLLLLLSFSIFSSELKSHKEERVISGETIEEDKFADNTTYDALFGGIYKGVKKGMIGLANTIRPVYDQLTKQNNAWSFFNVIFSSIIVFFLFYHSVIHKSRKVKALMVFSIAYFFLWFVLSSGIPWYGILGLAILPLAIAIFLSDDEQALGKDVITKGGVIVFIGIWFLTITMFRLVPPRISFVPISDVRSNESFFYQIMEPAFGKFHIGELKESDALKFLGKEKELMINTLNRDVNARVLKVGTFLNYHIAENDRRVFQDNQIDIFNQQFVFTGRDKTKTIQRFKNAGFKYFLIDLTTPSIDVTPNKTLTKKYNSLLESVVNNPQCRVVTTDRVVERPDGVEAMVQGKKMFIKNEIAGIKIIKPGTAALVELL